MKKKLLSMFIALITAISMLCTSVYAANGPKGGITIDGESYFLAYISFLETDETGEILTDEDWNPIGKTVFANNTVRNELSGAVYDRASNTLTITNLSATNMMLETNVMGDDFTLNVVGNCSIGQIVVWGDGYGGTLNIVGDGTLTVNQNKVFNNAIILNAEYSSSALKFGAGVKVNLYAKEDIAVVSQVPFDSADKAYAFANGKNPEIKKDLCKYEETKWIQGFEIVNLEDEGAWLSTVEKAEYSKDPTGIYGANLSKYFSDDGTVEKEGYNIIKLVYSEKYDAYFMDRTFGDEFGVLFIEKDDFATSDFKLVTDENGDQVQYENVYNSMNSYQVYADGAGKEYALGYDYNDGEEVTYVMDYEPIEGLENAYAFTKNTSVNVADLEPAYDTTVEDGFYTYTLTGTTFTYDGSNVSADKVIQQVDIGKSVENVRKAKQSMTVKGKTVKIKYKKLKKKKQTVKALIIKNAQGTVTYAKVKKGSSAKLTINKKTGKITVKKGTKKGTYKIKIKITAKGNAKYLAGSKTVTVKVKIC